MLRFQDISSTAKQGGAKNSFLEVAKEMKTILSLLRIAKRHVKVLIKTKKVFFAVSIIKEMIVPNKFILSIIT